NVTQHAGSRHLPDLDGRLRVVSWASLSESSHPPLLREFRKGPVVNLVFLGRNDETIIDIDSELCNFLLQHSDLLPDDFGSFCQELLVAIIEGKVTLFLERFNLSQIPFEPLLEELLSDSIGWVGHGFRNRWAYLLRARSISSSAISIHKASTFSLSMTFCPSSSVRSA